MQKATTKYYDRITHLLRRIAANIINRKQYVASSMKRYSSHSREKTVRRTSTRARAAPDIARRST